MKESAMVEKTVTVRDCMNRQVISLNPTDDLTDAVALLLEHRLSGAPVLDAARRIVGFVSEQDCIKDMLNTAFYCEPTATVADIMKSDVLVVDSDLPVALLAEQMTAGKPGLYPVVEEGVLMGSISRADVLKALLDASVRYHHKSAPPKGSQPKNPQG